MGNAQLGGRSFDVGGLCVGADLAPLAEQLPDALRFASIDDCQACDGEGSTEGRLYWSRSAGCYEAARVRCSSCRGYRVVEVETGEHDLADLTALDAAADAALCLSDREPGAVAALGGAIEDLFVALAGLLTLTVESAVELHERADEQGGAACRDEAADLAVPIAPVVVLPMRRSVAEAA